jgi:hypothetical protein
MYIYLGGFMGKINPDIALPKVVAYLELNRNVFYRPKDISESIDFNPEDGVTPHGLAMSLGNTINWSGARNYKTLEPVSQLRLWPSHDTDRCRPYGVYYAILDGEHEKEYNRRKGSWGMMDRELREGEEIFYVFEDGKIDKVLTTKMTF